MALEAIALALSDLIVGSADLTGSNLTRVKGVDTHFVIKLPAIISVMACANLGWRQ